MPMGAWNSRAKKSGVATYAEKPSVCMMYISLLPTLNTGGGLPHPVLCLSSRLNAYCIHTINYRIIKSRGWRLHGDWHLITLGRYSILPEGVLNTPYHLSNF